MQNTNITFTGGEMILLLLFVFAVIIGVYLFIVLKNANQFILEASATLRRNEQNVANLIANLEELSGNTALFSTTVRKQAGKYYSGINSLIHSGTESLLVVRNTTEQLIAFVANINEMISFVNRLFRK